MGKLKLYAIWFIVLALIAIFAMDAWLILKGDLESSISATLIEWSYKFPIFTFMIGFAMGHLFWRMRSTPGMEKIDRALKEME